MKTLQFGIIACSLGLFFASCGNNSNTQTETTDSTTTTQTMDTTPANTTDNAGMGTNGGSTNMGNGNAEGNNSNANGGNGGGKVINDVNTDMSNGSAAARSVSPQRTGNTNGIKSRVKKDSVNDLTNLGSSK